MGNISVRLRAAIGAALALGVLSPVVGFVESASAAELRSCQIKHGVVHELKATEDVTCKKARSIARSWYTKAEKDFDDVANGVTIRKFRCTKKAFSNTVKCTRGKRLVKFQAVFSAP